MPTLQRLGLLSGRLHNMTVVHLSTEVSGGAGEFVRNLHLAMLRQGLPSLLLSRERKDVEGMITVKPMRRLMASFRARALTAAGQLGVLDRKYAIFGVEKSPVRLVDIQRAVAPNQPSVFIFYWISYFVSFETILALRRTYPAVPFVLVCLDEAFLTGACHYSFGCTGYHSACASCPATTFGLLQARIERNFRQKSIAMREIAPIIAYPTSIMKKMGEQSAALKEARSYVVPLGALSDSERRKAMETRMHLRAQRAVADAKAILLVRSSSEYRKGCDLVVSALRILSQRYPDIRSRIEIVSIGDGTLSAARIDQYVNHTALGYVGRKELLALYTRIDALLVASREDAGPLMINECVAMGVFVISTPIGVAGDLITSDDVGLIISEICDSALAESLANFLDSCSSTAARPSALRTGGAGGALTLTFEGYIKSLLDVAEKNGALVR